MDHESTEPLPDEKCQQVLEIYRKNLPDADIVCLQDYNKGLLSEALCKQMIQSAEQADKRILVDPCLTRDYSKYARATVISPNRKEAAAAVGREINSVETTAKAAEQLMETLKLDAVVITLDKEGAYLKTKDISEMLPTRPRSVYDVTGAGDMVLATLGVTLAAGCDYKTAVQLSNIAGGLEVEKFGAATVTIEEIINEIISETRGKSGKVRPLDSLVQELAWRRRQKETVVFTNGCFDVVHRGHIEFLKFCKSQGDIVVLGLNSDASVKAIKGPDRPINNQYDRASVLAAMETVDYITVFDEPEPLNLIKSIKPDVLIKGQDWAEKGVVGREFVESSGGKVVLAPLVEGKSTTSVIEKMKALWKRL
jgi:D-beta-D-heptose 7-phosphate kinase/D-beta-D-heptose 1-phosphate adenosyltransferase